MLHEFERIALQKIALQKLNNSDLGVTTRIPKGEPAPAYSRNAMHCDHFFLISGNFHIYRISSYKALPQIILAFLIMPAPGTLVCR